MILPKVYLKPDQHIYQTGVSLGGGAGSFSIGFKADGAEAARPGGLQVGHFKMSL